MTRWVTEVPCEFPEIKEAACGSNEEWTWMSKVQIVSCPKNVLPDRRTITAGWTISWALGRLSLHSDYCSLEPPLRTTMWRANADGYSRPLCQLWIETGRFQIWKRKLIAGEILHSLDHWSKSYSWLLCRKYEWAKAEAVANLKVNRWCGEKSVK